MEDIASILGAQFVQTVPDESDEFARKSFLGLEQEKSVLDFFLFFFLQGLHECFKVAAVCEYAPLHAAKIQKVVRC